MYVCADTTLASSAMNTNYTNRLYEKLYNVFVETFIFAYIPCYYCVTCFSFRFICLHECGCAIALASTTYIDGGLKGRARTYNIYRYIKYSILIHVIQPAYIYVCTAQQAQTCFWCAIHNKIYLHTHTRCHSAFAATTSLYLFHTHYSERFFFICM